MGREWTGGICEHDAEIEKVKGVQFENKPGAYINLKE